MTKYLCTYTQGACTGTITLKAKDVEDARVAFQDAVMVNEMRGVVLTGILAA